MKSNLKKHSLIKTEDLDNTHYFQSLLQEAYRLKLLTDSELEQLQLQSIQLLATQTERYTGGQSSSVKIETAQAIFHSIYYSIGLHLKSLPDTDIAIATLKQKSLSELLVLGRALITLQLNNAEALLYAIQTDNFITNNLSYNETVQDGLPPFFSAYDLEFSAHDTPGSIDYPLSNDKMDLVGIEYIYTYLEKLSLENQFCKKFRAFDIHRLLMGYHEHYEDLLINIFEIVLTNALGSLLADKKIYQLHINFSDREYLQNKLSSLSQDNLYTLLKGASLRLYKELDISNSLLQDYISDTLIQITTRLLNALKNNCLESVFLSQKETTAHQPFHFKDGERMIDALFRTLTNEIRECRYVSDKITIIKKEIHSIVDLTALLEGYCIFDDEFAVLFQSLEDIELALLLKKIPESTLDPSLHLTENEKEWHDNFNSFLKEIDPSRRQCIVALSRKIIESQ